MTCPLLTLQPPPPKRELPFSLPKFFYNHANGTNQKAGVAILVSDKTDFKTKPVTKDKEGTVS